MTISWVEDLLPEGVLKKRMFGGFAFYLDEKLILVMFESEGNKSYRGVDYDFEIWNGCMFPVNRENQEAVMSRFPFLFNHPVLAKWLYVPAEREDFESQVEMIVRELRRRNPLFGTIPKPKKSKTSAKKENEDRIIDTRRPRMFSEEPVENLLKKAHRISDLKNLGPESEKVFLKAGIRTPQQLARLGWKKAMVQLCKSDPKNNHSIFAYAVIGALQGKMWNLISEDDKAEARALMKSLRENAAAPSKKKQPLTKKKKSLKKTQKKAVRRR